MAVDLHHMDSLDIASTFRPGSVDVIVTNPPYGLKMFKDRDYSKFYERVLDGAGHVLC